MATSGSVGSIKWHRCEKSIREGSWFEKSNLTIEEVLKFTYWCCQDLTQYQQIKRQLWLGSHTAIFWDMFCREVCEVGLFDGTEKIGGPGKLVQVDDGKIKRQYHRGHVVEGQRVFGASRTIHASVLSQQQKNERKKTLLRLIKEWIERGTTIVSNCWKGYVNLSKHGYIHNRVNHSFEFFNKEGFHTNYSVDAQGVFTRAAYRAFWSCIGRLRPQHEQQSKLSCQNIVNYFTSRLSISEQHLSEECFNCFLVCLATTQD